MASANTMDCKRCEGCGMHMPGDDDTGGCMGCGGNGVAICELCGRNATYTQDDIPFCGNTFCDSYPPPGVTDHYSVVERGLGDALNSIAAALLDPQWREYLGSHGMLHGATLAEGLVREAIRHTSRHMVTVEREGT